MTTEQITLKIEKDGKARTVVATADNGRLIVRIASKGGTPLNWRYVSQAAPPAEATPGWGVEIARWLIASGHTVTEIEA